MAILHIILRNICRYLHVFIILEYRIIDKKISCRENLDNCANGKNYSISVTVSKIQTVLIQQELLYSHNDDSLFRPPELDLVFDNNDLFERILYPD